MLAHALVHSLANPLQSRAAHRATPTTCACVVHLALVPILPVRRSRVVLMMSSAAVSAVAIDARALSCLTASAAPQAAMTFAPRRTWIAWAATATEVARTTARVSGTTLDASPSRALIRETTTTCACAATVEASVRRLSQLYPCQHGHQHQRQRLNQPRPCQHGHQHQRQRLSQLYPCQHGHQHERQRLHRHWRRQPALPPPRPMGHARSLNLCNQPLDAAVPARDRGAPTTFLTPLRRRSVATTAAPDQTAQALSTTRGTAHAKSTPVPMTSITQRTSRDVRALKRMMGARLLFSLWRHQ